MRSIRLRSITLPVGAVALVLGAVACDPSSSDSTSGGTTGGNSNGGVVQPDNSPDPLNVVVNGGNCYGSKNGTVEVRISRIRPGGGYSVKALYPLATHKNSVIANSSGAADDEGKATWSFTCGKLRKNPNYRIEAFDMNTGGKGTGTFDVLTEK
jgi:hypothetical protein